MGTCRGRRLAIRLAACAVIGAVLTVGVAWWLWISTSESGHPQMLSYPSGWPNTPAWPESLNLNWPAPEDHYAVSTFTCSDEIWAHHTKVDGLHTATAELNRFRVGVPFRAVSLDWLRWLTIVQGEDLEGVSGFEIDPVRFRWLCPRSPHRINALPAIPIWPGFALDTAFYAAIAFTLWSAPTAIVEGRHRRRARGRCPACGYDLKGSTSIVCPECGLSPKREGVAEGTEEVPSASAPSR
jgi:hypothetical protein